MKEQEREYLFRNTIDAILELLPHEEAHIWTDGEEILCDSEQAAETIADLLDTIYCGQVVNTGYYDPDEDARNDEVSHSTGYYYVTIN